MGRQGLISSNENRESSGVDGWKAHLRGELAAEKRFGQAIEVRFGGVEWMEKRVCRSYP